MSSEDDVPEELEEQCTKCHMALAGIEQLLQSVMSVSRTQTEEKLESLDAASEILLLTYSMNSLFWVYLATHGVDPKSHPIKRELERIQKAMQRARAISNKTKQAGVRINTGAAKRFVRNALWEAEEQQKGSPSHGEPSSSGKERNPVDDHDTVGNSGNEIGTEETGNGGSDSGSKKRKLAEEDTPNSDSAKRTRLK